MKFKLGNVMYGIRFTYPDNKITRVELIRFDPVGDSLMPMNTNIIGEAIRYYRDKTYSRSKGRKVAFTKLLKRMNQNPGDELHPRGFRLNKRTRARVWKIYFEIYKKDR